MTEREQVRPLAPAIERLSSDDDEVALTLKKLRRRKFVRCCGCVAVLLLIQAVVIIVLVLTVFRVKDPIIKMNGVTVTKLELINDSSTTPRPRPGSNMTLIADVSVKNPNVASFKYRNTSTTLYYYGTMVGEARGPPGRAKARRTMRMNITVDIIADQLLKSPNLNADMTSGVLTMTSYSRIRGRVNILNIIKKHVTVKMNCSMTVNISSQAIQDQACKRKVDL